ncbi:hypothetical protein C922_02187 [Plasmodium inui San Antonio 1]|uniref:Uncharacterized protein n=1 Tax=Plasmodium inui San Antonio 1 TaxID=1237626 RepID=W7APZ4_9APIC|nr:hypothetical protein C922_02187 [Plasmodium inui San Antonio 1]EUD67481.1 hypothetical protein C922_02187 [Plasmodium inui San Antonio 1]
MWHISCAQDYHEYDFVSDENGYVVEVPLENVQDNLEVTTQEPVDIASRNLEFLELEPVQTAVNNSAFDAVDAVHNSSDLWSQEPVVCVKNHEGGSVQGPTWISQSSGTSMEQRNNKSARSENTHSYNGAADKRNGLSFFALAQASREDNNFCGSMGISLRKFEDNETVHEEKNNKRRMSFNFSNAIQTGYNNYNEDNEESPRPMANYPSNYDIYSSEDLPHFPQNKRNAYIVDPRENHSSDNIFESKSTQMQHMYKSSAGTWKNRKSEDAFFKGEVHEKGNQHLFYSVNPIKNDNSHERSIADNSCNPLGPNQGNFSSGNFTSGNVNSGNIKSRNLSSGIFSNDNLFNNRHPRIGLHSTINNLSPRTSSSQSDNNTDKIDEASHHSYFNKGNLNNGNPFYNIDQVKSLPRNMNDLPLSAEVIQDEHHTDDAPHHSKSNKSVLQHWEVPMDDMFKYRQQENHHRRSIRSCSSSRRMTNITNSSRIREVNNINTENIHERHDTAESPFKNDKENQAEEKAIKGISERELVTGVVERKARKAQTALLAREAVATTEAKKRKKENADLFTGGYAEVHKAKKARKAKTPTLTREAVASKDAMAVIAAEFADIRQGKIVGSKKRKKTAI